MGRTVAYCPGCNRMDMTLTKGGKFRKHLTKRKGGGKPCPNPGPEDYTFPDAPEPACTICEKPIARDEDHVMLKPSSRIVDFDGINVHLVEHGSKPLGGAHLKCAGITNREK